MKYQVNYLVLHGIFPGRGIVDTDQETRTRQELHASTLDRACELAYTNLFRHADNYTLRKDGTTAAHLVSLVGDDHVPFASIADLLNGKARKEVKPERLNDELGILVMLDELEKQFFHQFGKRMIWRDGAKLTAETEHTTHRSVYICDQGHYGSTNCGNCYESLDDKIYFLDCPSCGYAFTEDTKYSY